MLSIERELYHAIKLPTCLSQLFGLFVGNFSELGKSKKQSQRIFRFLTIYTIFLLFLIAGLSVFSVLTFLRTDGAGLIKVSEFACIYTYIWTVFGLNLLNHTQKSQKIRMIRKLKKLSRKFQNYGLQINYEKIKRESQLILIAILVLWFAFGWQHFHISSPKNRNTLTSVIFWWIYYWPEKVILVQTFEICCYCRILGEHFRMLNSILKIFANFWPYKTANFLLIKQFEQLHCDLCAVCWHLNRFYSAVLLLLLTAHFIVIFSAIFLIYFGYYFDAVLIVPRSASDLIVPVVRLVTPIISLVLLVFCSNSVYEESLRTCVLLSQLQTFSDNDDLSFAIICTTTIYLVILTQFYR